MSEQKMRAALEFIRDKLRIDDEIECYDMVCEALSQREAVEPVAEIRTEDVGHPYNAMRVTVHFFSEVPPVGTKFYTAPPSREVPEEWVEMVRDLLSTYDQRLPLRERPDLWNIARALLASKGGAACV